MEIFIENVKNNPCLWDMDCLAYRDILLKDSTWNLLAAQAGMANGKEAQIIWKKLRNSHREALRRRKVAAASGNGSWIKPWKYEASMQFLLPGFEDTVVEQGTSNTESTHLGKFEIETVEEIIDPEIPATETKLHLTKPPQKRHTTSRKVTDSKAKMRQRNSNVQSGLRKMMIDSNRTISKNDSLSDLFSSLCKRTRIMPKHLQLRVQREIFDSVCQAEEEMLNYDDPRERFGSVCQAEEEMLSCDEPVHSTILIKMSPRSEGENPIAMRDDYGACDIDK